MTPESYRSLSEILLKRIGLVLGDGKDYLLTSRLTPIAEKNGMSSLDALISAVQRPANARLLESVVDAMTTNETSFFRDGKPFETLFKEVLPKLMQRRQTRRIRIWNAACSTGQEPYSILMGISERIPELLNWDLSITATDVSPTVLEKARSGIYNHFEVQRGLPALYLVKYFEQKERDYQLKQDLRRRVRFSPLNLLEPFKRIGEQDIIFVRNVLIYFDPEVKREILNRMAQCLAPDGCLFLGSTESILGLTDSLQRAKNCSTTVFCRQEAVSEIKFA